MPIFVVHEHRATSLHWDLRIHSDTVGLSDLTWIAPAIPRTGGGSMDLHVKTDRD